MLLQKLDQTIQIEILWSWNSQLLKKIWVLLYKSFGIKDHFIHYQSPSGTYISWYYNAIVRLMMTISARNSKSQDLLCWGRIICSKINSTCHTEFWYRLYWLEAAARHRDTHQAPGHTTYEQKCCNQTFILIMILLSYYLFVLTAIRFTKSV